MAEHFTEAQWQVIEARLDADPRAFGVPERRAGSVVLASWNIRKLGALRDGGQLDAGQLKKSPGATRMLARFLRQCDLIAIQEVQTDTAALYDLRDRLNAGGRQYEVVISDVTGRVPGMRGAPERFGWLYDSARVRRGDLASDLGYDRSAIVKSVNHAIEDAISREVGPPDTDGFLDRVTAFLGSIGRRTATKFGRFVDFIRSPHLVGFVIEGPDGSAYRLHCVNAHLVSTGTKTDRAREFFALLEWLLLDSKTSVSGGTSYVVLADLNLDFESSLDRRRSGIAGHVTAINAEKKVRAHVNFPFLDKGFMTNARADETFDQIYWVTEDPRLPKGRHNALAGTLGPDGYDLGMFDFVRLFTEAGPGQMPDGSPDFARFEHDFTDHMPIWVRLPVPNVGQALFEID